MEQEDCPEVLAKKIGIFAKNSLCLRNFFAGKDLGKFLNQEKSGKNRC
jgi:hypothetical protein